MGFTRRGVYIDGYSCQDRYVKEYIYVKLIKCFIFSNENSGNLYLARLQFRQCQYLNPKYPDVDHIINVIEDAERVMYARYLPSEGKPSPSWRQRLMLDLSWSAKRRIAQPYLMDSTFLERRVFAIIEELPSCAVNLGDIIPVDQSEEALEWKTLLRKIFYEGQVLFMEGLYHSAEVKYITFVALMMTKDDTILRGELNGDTVQKTFFLPSSFGKYFSRMKIAALSNIATCRLKRNSLSAKPIPRFVHIYH